MKEELISFETAKLAKKKGFDAPTLYYFDINYETVADTFSMTPITNWSVQPSLISAPSQSLLQRWLRTVHHMDVLVRKIKGSLFVYSYNINYDIYVGIPNKFETYEEALEKGLQRALTLI